MLRHFFTLASLIACGFCVAAGNPAGAVLAAVAFVAVIDATKK